MIQQIHRPRHPWSCEILREITHEGTIILKQLPATTSVAGFIGRWLLKREIKVLNYINCVAPELAPVILESDNRGFLMRDLGGVPLSSIRADLVGELELFKKLEKAVTHLHTIGIAHGELRLGNIQLANRNIFILDFSTAVRRGNILFQIWKCCDLMALATLKQRFIALPLHQAEIELLATTGLSSFLYKRFLDKDLAYG